MLNNASYNVSSESQKRKKAKIMPKMAGGIHNIGGFQNVECDDEAEDFNEVNQIYQEKNESF